MDNLPPALKELVDAFKLLPGVGSRSAERYAYSILKKSPKLASELSRALEELHDGVGYCEITFALVGKGEKQSQLYTDPMRDKTVVLVVAEPLDVITIENTGMYKGTYHVLGGLVSPIDNIGPEELRMKELVSRVSKDNVKEIILATNASVEGESTALYLKQQLEPTNVKITRLARGIPIGVDIEYTDHITLGRALEGRQDL
ncbi:recombination protein RecR [bacterium]|nr:recombination protein RecR [bacterium]